MNNHVIVFNKVSKEYFAVVSPNAIDQVDKNFFTTKTVEFNDTTHEWDGGNLDNGQVIAKGDSIPVITESDLDATCGKSITDVYQTHHELNAIIDVLSQIIETQNMSGAAIDKFNEVKNFIANRRLINERYKLAYQNDTLWNYVSKEQEQEDIDRLYDGGLYEKITTDLLYESFE
jgi:hypothetical protein